MGLHSVKLGRRVGHEHSNSHSSIPDTSAIPYPMPDKMISSSRSVSAVQVISSGGLILMIFLVAARR